MGGISGMERLESGTFRKSAGFLQKRLGTFGSITAKTWKAGMQQSMNAWAYGGEQAGDKAMERRPKRKSRIRRFLKDYPSIPLFLVSFLIGSVLVLLAKVSQ